MQLLQGMHQAYDMHLNQGGMYHDNNYKVFKASKMQYYRLYTHEYQD
jgi:hypothetical protein